MHVASDFYEAYLQSAQPQEYVIDSKLYNNSYQCFYMFLAVTTCFSHSFQILIDCSLKKAKNAGFTEFLVLAQLFLPLFSKFENTVY